MPRWAYHHPPGSTATFTPRAASEGGPAYAMHPLIVSDFGPVTLLNKRSCLFVGTDHNAVESHLDSLGPPLEVDLAGAMDINAKLDKFFRAKKLRKKRVYVGEYLGHVRKAADHGVDPDFGASWSIRNSTRIEYVFVACSFMATVTDHAQGNPAQT